MMKPPRMRTYKLVDRVAVPCEFIEMALSRGTGEDSWRVAIDKLSENCVVSTVFLGLDMNPFDGAPRLFETAIFDRNGLVDVVGRCATWEQAEEQHAEAVRAARTNRPIL